MSQQISFALKFSHIPDIETVTKALTLLRRSTNNSGAEEIAFTIKATASIPDDEPLLPTSYTLLPPSVQPAEALA